MPYVVFARHGASLKNEFDRHGGPGSKLSSQGIQEAIELSKQIASHRITPKLIYTSPVSHVIETASILSQSWCGIDVIENRLIKPLDLGILSGLSNAEARIAYPEVYELMDKWRKGDIELHSLAIPKSEDYSAFYKRGEAFLGEILKSPINDIVVVGTRSILICLVNIMLGKSIMPNGGYRNIDIQPCDYFTFDFQRNFLSLKSRCAFTRGDGL